MFERFTHEARAVVVLAHEEARALHHQHIGTEHLLLALLGASAGPAATALADAGVDRERVRSDISRLVGGEAVLGERDAAALRSIGIDLDAVLARIASTFGPGALDLPGPDLPGLDVPAGPGRGGRRRFGYRVRPGNRGRQRLSGRGGFSRRAKKVLELSLREAVALRHHHIGAEHLLLGLLREGGGLACQVLVEAGVNLKELRVSTLSRLDVAA